jgi:hypothetical protein
MGEDALARGASVLDSDRWVENEMAGLSNDQARTVLVAFLKALSALALGLSIAGCIANQQSYPNVVPIDTTGNFGAR